MLLYVSALHLLLWLNMFHCLMDSFLRDVAVKVGDLNQQECVLSVMESSKAEVEALVGPQSLYDSAYNPCLLIPRFERVYILDFPCLAVTSLQSLPLSSLGLLPVCLHLHVEFSSLYMDTSCIALMSHNGLILFTFSRPFSK